MNILLVAIIILASIITYLLGKTYIEYAYIQKMKQREKELKSAGINSTGSSLSHGMYVNKVSGEVKHDQIESVAWYKRLAG